MELVSGPLLSFTLVAVVCGLLWQSAATAEKYLRPAMRQALSDWLFRGNVERGIEAMPRMSYDLFNMIFGKRHFTFFCLLRSSFFSVGAVFLILFIFITLFESHISLNISLTGENFLVVETLTGVEVGYTFAFFAAGTFVNLVPDYIALLKTRYVLGYILQSRSLLRIWLILYIDLLATVVIGGLAILLVVLATVSHDGLSISSFNMALRYFMDGIFLFSRVTESNAAFLLVGVFFYSTFMTSIWAWQLLVLIMFGRGAGAVLSSLHPLSQLFDMEEAPLRSLAGITIVLILGAYFSLILLLRISNG